MAWTKVSRLYSGLQARALDPGGGTVTAYFWALVTPALQSGRIWTLVLPGPAGPS